MSRRKMLFESGGEDPTRLTWERVLQSIENGSYKTDYSIGDVIPLDLGTEGQIDAEIADFDHDILSGGGKAHISFIAKHPCASKSNMRLENAKDEQYGWYFSNLRQTFLPNILTKMPTILQNSIIPVGKYSNVTIPTTDYIWIPSATEVNSTLTVSHSDGTVYPIFTDNDSRKKESAWWLRTRDDYKPESSTSLRFGRVTPAGGTSFASPTQSLSVIIGFCL